MEKKPPERGGKNGGAHKTQVGMICIEKRRVGKQKTKYSKKGGIRNLGGRGKG